MKRRIIDATARLYKATSSAEHVRSESEANAQFVEDDAGTKMPLEEMRSRIEKATGFSGFVVLQQKQRRIQGQIPAASLHGFAVTLKHTLGFEHLSAISCVDWIDEGRFELVYHFWNYEQGILVQAKISIDRKQPAQPTITDLWQPAKFFERDIHEMFGVDFPGNEDLSRYILSDWEGPPPMRKDFHTREFAYSQYHFKDYEPEWDGKVQGGYHSNRAAPDAEAQEVIIPGRKAHASSDRWWKEAHHE
jgi:NADH-quinone oxidoreductase subunit C